MQSKRQVTTCFSLPTDERKMWITYGGKLHGERQRREEKIEKKD